MAALTLLTPTLETLPGFVDALERGWSRDNIGGPKTTAADLQRIAADAAASTTAANSSNASRCPRPMARASSFATASRSDGFQAWIGGMRPAQGLAASS